MANKDGEKNNELLSLATERVEGIIKELESKDLSKTPANTNYQKITEDLIAEYKLSSNVILKK